MAERAQELLGTTENDPLSLEMNVGLIWGVFEGTEGRAPLGSRVACSGGESELAEQLLSFRDFINNVK